MPNHIPLTKAEIEKLPEAEQQSALQDIGRFLGQLLNTETDKAKKLIAKLANEFDFDPNALMDMAQPQSMSDVAGMALPGAGLAMGAIKGVSGAMKGKAAAGGMGKTEPILQSRMGKVLRKYQKHWNLFYQELNMRKVGFLLNRQEVYRKRTKTLLTLG